jgi:hypothetical protein
LHIGAIFSDQPYGLSFDLFVSAELFSYKIKLRRR